MLETVSKIGMKLDKETFGKWIKWTEKVKNDLTQIIHKKQIYDYFIEVVNANLKHIENNNGILFCNFIRECYAVQAAVSIRRHIKTDDDSISLIKLLEQIKTCAAQLTYDFYLGIYPIKDFEWQKSTFQKFSKNGKVVDGEIIDDDIQKLKDIGDRVSDFVDRAIAHLDKRGSDEKVTYDDLGQVIDLFNEIACKYITFVTSGGYSSLQPIIQFDWQKIFTVPLDIRNQNKINKISMPFPDSSLF